MPSRPQVRDFISQVSSKAEIFSSQRVLSHVVAGAHHLLAEYAENLASKSIPDSENPDILLAWCNLYGIKRKAASRSVISVEFESSEPVLIPQGTQFVHESGLSFEILKEQELDGRKAFQLTSSGPGSQTNVSAGSLIKISATLAGLRSSGRVLQLDVEAFDAEALESLRERIRERLRRPPQGGCTYDYINWALEHPAVHRAWVLPRPPDQSGKRQNGLVHIAAIKKNGLLTDAERISLQSLISDRCPVTATPKVVEISKKPVKITLDLEWESGVASDRRKEMLTDELEYMFEQLATPRGFLNSDLQTETGTIYLSSISEAISMLPWVKNHRIVSPSKHMSPKKTGEILFLGEVNL